MSLLTEKQISEIIDMATQQSEFAKILKLKLNHWNKNQKDQFAPCWDIIPDEVMEIQLKIDWLKPDTGDYYEDPFLIKIYTRPLRAHPHAEIMMKYAEVAARRIDPWVEFEIYSESFDNWIALEVPTFFDSVLKYRHIGDNS
jgi:hypothetical protein